MHRHTPPAAPSAAPSALAAILLSTVLLTVGSSRSLAQATPPAAPQPAAALPAPPPGNYTFVPAVPFAHPGGAELVADFYLPHGTGPFPAILFIHGGGWNSGNRTQLRRQAAYIAERGFVGMTIEYRLAPANPFPAAIVDSREALRWLRQNAATYKIDPTRIAAVGSSAGGHLVAMLGVEKAVQAVVALNGIYDLAAMPPSDMISNFLGKPCAQTTDLCRDASPIDHIGPGAPPFLIMHGDADQTAPYPQAKAFAEKLQAAHDPVDFVTVPGAPHTFWSKPQWAQMSDERMAAFLIKTLKP